MIFKNNEQARAGMVFSVAVLANLVFQLIFSVVMQAAGIQSLGDSVPLFFVAQVLLPLCTIGAVWLYVGRKKYVPASVWSFRKPRVRDVLLAVGLGFAVCFACGMLNELFSAGLRALGVPDLMGGSMPAVDSVGILLLFVVVLCILPALSEELTFRGAMVSFMGSAKTWVICLLTGALFSLMHMNLYQMLNAFLVGMILALVTVRSGSVWPAVLIHLINNLVTVFQEFFTNLLKPAALFLHFSVADVVLALLGLAFIAFSLWYYIFRQRGVRRIGVSYPADASPLPAGRVRDGAVCMLPGIVLCLFFLILNLVPGV